MKRQSNYQFVDIGNSRLVISYNTPVCLLKRGTPPVRYWDGYSVTTLRHISKARMDYCRRPMGKAEWDTLPVTEFNLVDGDQVVDKIVQAFRAGEKK